LGENAFPELLQNNCKAEKLAAALLPLIAGGPTRDAQIAALARIPERVELQGAAPSQAAADAVLRVLAYSSAGKSRLGGPM
jgi:lipid-A-disaccharide synthase